MAHLASAVCTLVAAYYPVFAESMGDAAHRRLPASAVCKQDARLPVAGWVVGAVGPEQQAQLSVLPLELLELLEQAVPS